MNPSGATQRDAGLRQVGRVTGWLVGGAIALTALVTGLVAASTGSKSTRAPASVSAGVPAAAPNPQPSYNDPGLQPLPAPSRRYAAPPQTSTRGS